MEVCRQVVITLDVSADRSALFCSPSPRRRTVFRDVGTCNVGAAVFALVHVTRRPVENRGGGSTPKSPIPVFTPLAQLGARYKRIFFFTKSAIFRLFPRFRIGSPRRKFVYESNRRRLKKRIPRHRLVARHKFKTRIPCQLLKGHSARRIVSVNGLVTARRSVQYLVLGPRRAPATGG